MRHPPRILVLFHWAHDASIRGALSYCKDHGLPVTVADMSNADTLNPADFDGVVGMLPPPSHRLHRLIVGARLPVVELTLAYPENEHWGRFHSAGKEAGAMAAGYLGRLGAASFLFVGNRGSPMDRLREAGFLGGLKRAGRHAVSFDIAAARPPVAPRSLESAGPALEACLRALPKPAGVFVTVDDTARWVCDTALRSGFSVPGDLLVMGFGNREPIADAAPVSLTSIDIDYAGWAYEATAMLEGMLAGTVAPGTHRVFRPGK